MAISLVFWPRLDIILTLFGGPLNLVFGVHFNTLECDKIVAVNQQ